MATQDALQTMGMSGDAAAARQSQVNDTNDFDLSGVTKSGGGAQIDKGPSASTPKLTSGLPKTKRAAFSASKEDPKLLEKMASENDTAGKVNGVPAFIDGYLRIQKRRYGSRGQYGIISKGYKI
jgi:hypothetical protein